MPLLKKLPDPRNQSYITYPSAVLLMTRILSSIFYISSMRKTSEEFNSDLMIENIWERCAEEETVRELPYWETINRYLEKLEPESLREVIWKLVYRLLRSKAFQGARIGEKHWQIILDGTQLHSSRKPLDPKCMYRIHHKGRPEEYRENYYYVLEAKLVLHPKIVVSIMTEFVENEGFNTQKNQGYYLEHLFSKNYQGIKNHYYLIQIGHMIAQIMERWGRLWEGMHLSMEQKHQKILESFQAVRLKES